MYGVSIYLSDLETAEQACADARRHGFELLFTSLHLPEDDSSATPRLLRELGSIARRHQLLLIADISGRSLAALGLTASSAGELRRWGVHGLRIDDGAPAAEIAHLTGTVPVYLNASTLDGAELNALSAGGVDLTAVESIHNFYPKPHTGLAAAFLVERNRSHHEKGMAVGAFVAGDGSRRGPVGAGLPTLEQHRTVHPLAAAIELSELGTDHIYIGDPGLRVRTADQWGRYLRDNTIDLTITATAVDTPTAVRERLRHTDTNRPDPSRDVIRLRGSRDALRGVSIPPSNTVARPVGTVSVDNDRSGRYRGEITVSVADLPPDPTVNVIGTVLKADHALLSVIGADDRVAFTAAP